MNATVKRNPNYDRRYQDDQDRKWVVRYYTAIGTTLEKYFAKAKDARAFARKQS